MFPANPAREQLSALAAELLASREAILDSWRSYGEASPGRNIAASLSRLQFNDHIPGVLDTLSASLSAWPELPASTQPGESEEGAEHGMQRWQQGYSLSEVLREWGYLQMCVAAHLERYAAEHPTLEPTVMPTARKVWAQLCADGVTGSATQYGRLQQTESAGHVSALEVALAALHSMEQSRAEAWRVAAHDLRGSVTVVKGAASLVATDLPDATRSEVTQMLSKGVTSLNDMLNDLLSLARLEAGQEQRTVTEFDAAVLLQDFCAASQAAATDRGLFLKMDGPSTLPVAGDRAKILRILQNLLLNAVKYTESGGVSVSWGLDTSHDTDRWTFSVQDTGSGIEAAQATTLANELREATEVASEVVRESTDDGNALAAPPTLRSRSGPPDPSQHGEGVGLSIVKKLCELLEASLELATQPGRGTTFRVILPRSYEG